MNLKSKFCPNCGKETKELVEGLCPECYYRKYLVKYPKRVKITVCNNCNAVKFGGKWLKTNSWKYWLTQDLMKKIKLPSEAKLEDLKLINIGENGKVRIWIAVRDEIFTETKEISMNIKHRRCKLCKVKKSKTWNSKIQLRASEKTIREIIQIVPKDYLIRIKPVTNGIDIYFSEKNEGKAFASRLKNKYDLNIKSSFEQRGWDKSKNTSHKLNVILLRE